MGEFFPLAHLTEAVANDHGVLLHPGMERASTPFLSMLVLTAVYWSSKPSEFLRDTPSNLSIADL